MESRTGTAISVVERFGGGPQAHPAEWSERADELLGEWFELDAKLLESPNPAPPPALADQIAALRAGLEAVDERFADRKPSYSVVLGRRR